MCFGTTPRRRRTPVQGLLSAGFFQSIDHGCSGLGCDVLIYIHPRIQPGQPAHCTTPGWSKKAWNRARHFRTPARPVKPGDRPGQTGMSMTSTKEAATDKWDIPRNSAGGSPIDGIPNLSSTVDFPPGLSVREARSRRARPRHHLVECRRDGLQRNESAHQDYWTSDDHRRRGLASVAGYTGRRINVTI